MEKYSISIESLICCVCHECWLDKDPRVLPCQHTYCFNCISKFKINNSKIRCALCNEEFFVLNGDASNIRKCLLPSWIQVEKFEKNMCPKHEIEGNIICITHNIENICSKCVDEYHKNCETITVKEKEERKKGVEIWFKNEILMKKSILHQINDEKYKYDKESDTIFNGIIDDMIKLFQLREIKFLHHMKINEYSKPFENQSNLKFKCSFEKVKMDYKFENNVENNFEMKAHTVKQDIFKILSNHNLCLKRFCSDNILHNNLSMPFIRIKLSDANLYEDLSFFHFCSNETDMNKLRIFLKNNPIVETFHANNIAVERDDFRMLLQDLSLSASCLKEICLTNNSLINTDFEDFTNSLKNCWNLKTLRIYTENIINSKFSLIPTWISKTGILLENLSIINCNLNENLCKDVAKLLIKCPKIETIDFSWNRTMEGGVNYISNTLSINHLPLLHSINFSNCNLSQVQAEKIGLAISNYVGLKEINLHYNTGMKNSFIYICKCLNSSKFSLQVIKFSQCNLEEKMSSIICELLKNCQSIKIVHLNGNPKLKSRILPICQEMIKYSSTLKEVYLHNCNLDNNHKQKVKEILNFCKTLKL